MIKIGITENSDPIYDKSWERWALEKREPTILITKNFTELIKQYPLLLSQNNIIVHATITGYGSSFLEPNVPNPQSIVDMLRCNIYKERVVIRIDPIVPLPQFVKQSKQIFDYCKAMGYQRFRVSILDLYPHVVKRLEPYCTFLYELKQVYNWDLAHSGGEHQPYMVYAPLHIRQSIIDQFPDVEVCAEPGIKCSGCISRKDLELFGIVPEKRYIKNDQREFCQCLGIKKELLRSHNCQSKCLYCYWLNN